MQTLTLSDFQSQLTMNIMELLTQLSFSEFCSIILSKNILVHWQATQLKMPLSTERHTQSVATNTHLVHLSQPWAQLHSLPSTCTVLQYRALQVEGMVLIVPISYHGRYKSGPSLKQLNFESTVWQTFSTLYYRFMSQYLQIYYEQNNIRRNTRGKVNISSCFFAFLLPRWVLQDGEKGLEINTAVYIAATTAGFWRLLHHHFEIFRRQKHLSIREEKCVKYESFKLEHDKKIQFKIGHFNLVHSVFNNRCSIYNWSIYN